MFLHNAHSCILLSDGHKRTRGRNVWSLQCDVLSAIGTKLSTICVKDRKHTITLSVLPCNHGSMSKVTPEICTTLEPSASGSRLGLVSEGFHRFNSTDRQFGSIIIGFMEVIIDVRANDITNQRFCKRCDQTLCHPVSPRSTLHQMEQQVPEAEFAELLRTQLSGRYPVFRSRAIRPTDAKEKEYSTWDTQSVADFDVQVRSANCLETGHALSVHVCVLSTAYVLASAHVDICGKAGQLIWTTS